MREAAFIGGDWGTSRLRLALCDGAGRALARQEGDGVLAGDCAARLARMAAPWQRTHGPLPVMLSGMVGSTIGWREVPYLACPAGVDAIAGAALRFEADGCTIVIAPGLSCRNPLDAPDVLRGEETQILGALRLQPDRRRGRHFFCLPGTHTKWVVVEDGAVRHFQTALSGELFDLLRRHSVLARDAGAPGPGGTAFALGLDFARSRHQAGLLHLLFSTRSRQLAGEIAPADAAAYLSGLIVGADAAAAVTLFGLSGSIGLICTPFLATLYEQALAPYGLTAAAIDGDAAALAGLAAIHAARFERPL